MVEGALIAPLFFALVLAVMELGPLYLHWSGVKDAAREGARTGSTAGRSALADHAIVTAVRKSLGGRVSSLKFLIVFKSDGPTDGVPAQCLSAAESGLRGWTSGGADPTDRCTVYRVPDFIRPESNFGYQAIANPTAVDVNWPGGDRKDWVNGPPDFVGVYARGRYEGVTGIFPARNLNSQIIVQIEPRKVNE